MSGYDVCIDLCGYEPKKSWWKKNLHRRWNSSGNTWIIHSIRYCCAIVSLQLHLCVCVNVKMSVRIYVYIIYSTYYVNKKNSNDTLHQGLMRNRVLAVAMILKSVHVVHIKCTFCSIYMCIRIYPYIYLNM